MRLEFLAILATAIGAGWLLSRPGGCRHAWTPWEELAALPAGAPGRNGSEDVLPAASLSAADRAYVLRSWRERRCTRCGAIRRRAAS